MQATSRERRCIVSGETGSAESRIRFVRGPEGQLVPDVAANLPGRGAWVAADRETLRTALKRRLFARSFKAPTEIPPALEEQVEALLAKRCVELLGLARRAGQAVAGFAKVEAIARAGRVGALLTAIEGAEDGRRRLYGLAGNASRITVLRSAELGLAFGRESVIHAAVAPGRLADRLVIDSRRLAGFRSAGEPMRGPSGSGGSSGLVIPDELNCGEPTLGGYAMSPMCGKDS